MNNLLSLFDTEDYNNSTIPSMEAISFQEVSHIGNNLTKAFQKVIDYRTKLYEENKSEKEIVMSIIEYCTTTLKKDMLKAFENKTLNFKVSDIEMNINDKSSDLGMYAILMTIKNDIEDKKMIKIFTEETGIFNGTTIGDLEVLIDDVRLMYQNVDLEKSKIKSMQIGDTNLVLQATIYFDVILSFLSKELLSPNFRHMEACELTAIMLHEVGHFFDLCERSNTNLLKFLKLQKGLDTLLVHNNIESVITNILPKLSELFITLANKQNLNKIYTSSITKVINTIIDKKNTICSLVDQTTKNSIPFIRSIFYLIGILVQIICSTLYSIILGNLFIQMYNSYLIKNASSGELSVSDVIITGRNTYAAERNADNFAVRHGYGSYLISALAFTKEVLIMVNVVPLTLNNTNKTVYNLFYFLARFQQVFSPYIGLQFTIYERDFQREKRILQNVLAAFKKENMSSKMFENFYTQYLRIVKQLNDLESQKLSKTEAIWKFINEYFSLGGIYESLFIGRLSKDYEKLLNDIDTIINNKLFLQYQRLVHII